jgi:hypothetical protein
MVSSRFYKSMRFVAVLFALLLATDLLARTSEEPKLLARVAPLPVALDDAFQFRKTKLYFLSENAPGQSAGGEQAAQTTGKGGKLSSTAPSSKSTTVQDASITFERRYRLFGAVTKLDRRERYGNYFDFFWRAQRPAAVTVRLEYRQEKLHAHVQAQEISYPNVHGTRKTEFKVVGDDYFDDGRVIAWRCLLIENGKIVAENRSYSWD